VAAQVLGAPGPPVRVPLSQLLSPKDVIPRDPRFQNVLRGIGQDVQTGGSSVPPIEIVPILPGSSTSGLTPVAGIRLLKWRGF
jgi:hypothetical protein